MKSRNWTENNRATSQLSSRWTSKERTEEEAEGKELIKWLGELVHFWILVKQNTGISWKAQTLQTQLSIKLKVCKGLESLGTRLSKSNQFHQLSNMRLWWLLLTPFKASRLNNHFSIRQKWDSSKLTSNMFQIVSILRARVQSAAINQHSTQKSTRMISPNKFPTKKS